MDTGDYKDLLTRVDERTTALYKDLNEIKDNIEKIRTTNIQKLINQQSILDDIAKIKENIKELNKEIKEEYVKKIEFSPIQKAVFAIVTLIVSLVITGIFNGVFQIPGIKH